MTSIDLPIACNLTAPELQERRRTVLQKVRSAVVEVRELENGYAYSFPSAGDWLVELAGLIDLEPFQLKLLVGFPGGWLSLARFAPG